MSLPPVGPELEKQEITPQRRDDPKLAGAKIAIFQYAAVGVFIFLVTGFWALQVQNPQFYDEQAERNSIKSMPILAPRGKILDRDGRVIVDNHSTFSLMLSRENLKQEHLRAHCRRPGAGLRRFAGTHASLPVAAEVHAPGN